MDVVEAEPRGRLPWGPLGAGAALILALVAVAVVLPDGPAGPVAVRVAGLDGTAVRGETFVRLHLDVRAEGARSLGDLRLSLPGLTPGGSLGSSVEGLDDDGRADVQVDLVPACPLQDGALRGGTLDVTVVDAAGRSRVLRALLPLDSPLERLVRYRCAT